MFIKFERFIQGHIASMLEIQELIPSPYDHCGFREERAPDWMKSGNWNSILSPNRCAAFNRSLNSYALLPLSVKWEDLNCMTSKGSQFLVWYI